MTRSDLILAVHKVHDHNFNNLASSEPACFMLGLIDKMHKKIENAYTIAIGLENDPKLKELGEYLRKALES